MKDEIDCKMQSNIVRPMTIARAFAAFFCGVLAGWLVVACFMMVHERDDIGSVRRFVTLWLPVAVVYSVIIVAASHRLLARFAPTLLLLLGCVVGVVLLATRFGAKRVVPVAVGLAAGMAVGFFLGAMVTRHDEPIVVIHNATDETLRWVSITTDFHTGLDGIPEGASYTFDKLQPHHTWTDRLSSHRLTVLDVRATTAGGKQAFEREGFRCIARRPLCFGFL